MTVDAVPDPRRPSRALRPPEEAGPGRILFFVLGIATAVVTAAVAMQLMKNHRAGIPREAAYVIPAIALAWVVRGRHRHGERWRWVSFIVGGLSVPACALAYDHARPPVRDWYRTTDFDSAVWRSRKPRSVDRVWMVDDLLARDLVGGRSIRDAETLLGRADPADSGLHTDNRVERVWDLGFRSKRPGRPRVYEFLVLRLSPTGTVVEARIVRH